MASTPEMQLGAFALHVHFRTGGTGEVWWGRHLALDRPVAIKVLRPELARQPERAAAFRREVREIARLDHPRILRALDQGTIPPEVERASDGRLRAGTPYFVMEYASLGSLRERAREIDERRLVTLIDDLLSGLAHAHARGVLHLDLKPDNLLLTHEAGGVALKLADFGLGVEGAGDSVAGTPWYMAPEQVRAQPAAFGPWTDLYAVGALIWELVTGAPPFAFRVPRQVLQSHLHASPPEFRPRLRVPQGLEGWLRLLLLKSPAERPATVADARRSLEEAWSAGAGSGNALCVLGDPLPAGKTHNALSDPASGSRIDETTTLRPEDALAAMAEPPPAPLRRASIPEQPPRPGRDGAPDPLTGLGIGLLGLRSPANLGQERVLARLWSELREVAASRAPRAVILRGAPDVGVVPLARAFTEMANEVAGVPSLLVRCGAAPEGEAVRTALAAALPLADPGDCCLDLDPEDLSRLQVLGPAALTRSPGLSSSEHTALLARAVRAWGCRRPSILVLEGSHEDPGAVAVAQSLLNGPAGSLPLLIVATTEGTTSGSDSVALPGADELRVEPIDDRAMVALLRGGLGLEPELARLVADRVEGSVLFAAQLVVGWADQGALEPGAGGIRAAPGAVLSLPESLSALWESRLSVALQGRPPSAWLALELGALLGREVEQATWERCLDRLGVEPPGDLLEALQVSGLLVVGPRSWRFDHELLRQTLEARAREGGDWARLHAACAEVLQGIPEDTPGRAARVGRHLLEAGAVEAGLDALLGAIQQALDRVNLEEAALLIAASEAALPHLPSADGRRMAASLSRVRLHLLRGEFAEADALGGRLAVEARRQGWVIDRARALRYRAMAASRLGDLERAEALLRQAEPLAVSEGDPGEVARCLLHLGIVLRQQGDRQGALTALHEAERGFKAIGDDIGTVDTLAELANVYLTLGGDDARAAAVLQEAIPLYEAMGRGLGVAYCLNTLGDLHRRRQAWDEAQQAYRRARDLINRAGGHNWIFAVLNLGLLDLERGRVAEARATLEEGLAAATGSRRRGVLPYFHAGLLVCAAHGGDAASWGQHLRALGDLLAETGLEDKEIRALLARAVREAEARGDVARATDAAALARSVGATVHAYTEAAEA